MHASGLRVAAHAAAREAPHEVAANRSEDGPGHRRRRIRGDPRQDRRSQESGNAAGHAKAHHRGPVHVAKAPMGGTGDQRGAQLCRMHDGGRLCRAKAREQQHRRGRDAKAHTNATVDQLRGEARQCNKNKRAHINSLL